MAFPGSNYAPPGVFTQTQFENPLSQALESLKIPTLIGEGNEELLQAELEIVRGSSSSADQKVVDEDVSGRSVVSVSRTGVVTLGDANAVLDKVQVRHFPIVTGDGTGTTTNNRTDVQVTVNGQPVVVRSVTGASGIIQLAQPPAADAEVLVTYFFDRTDTLVTDDVSAQVPNTVATVRGAAGLASGEAIGLHGDITVAGVVTSPANNVLNLKVDGVVRSFTIPARSNYNMVDLAAAITNAASATSLEASTFTNHLGHTALLLTADSSLEVLSGSANAEIFLVAGAADNRTSTFYVFNGPIVDGSGGGVTTTDPSHVTVKVNGRQVIPTAVDGASRAVTLAVAPVAGATVSIAYYWNSWQDTFDYLAHIGVTRVVRTGTVPGGSDYVQGADFVLQNDKIVWGTASTVEAGVHTDDSAEFGESQITLSLVDNRNFLAECPPVVSASGGVAQASKTRFTLPLQPTLGNGRDTPLGSSLYQTISNGRLDLPVNRPDVVWAYWGWDAQDAIGRGRVEVTSVDGQVITLAEAVPVGAKVFATSYYNQIQDETYTVSAASAGISGSGTYEITNSDGATVYGASLGVKGAGLTGIAVEFPGGSELTPDFRFESVSGDDFTGPVEESVTVTFAARPAGPARFTFPGAAPYHTISGVSDYLRVQIRGNESPSAAGVHLKYPAVSGTTWSLAHLVGEEIEYAGGAGAVVGESFTPTAAEQFSLDVDGTEFVVTIPVSTGVDATYIAQYINEAANGHNSTCAAGSGAQTIVLNEVAEDAPDGYYVGYKVVIAHDAVTVDAIAGGQTRTVTAYTASTRTATLNAVWAGSTPPPEDQPYYIFNPAARSAFVGATQFDSPVTISSARFDSLRLHYTGDVTGASGNITATIASATYATAAALATAVESAITTGIASLTGGTAKFKGLAVEVTANADSKLEFRIILPGQDSSGYLKIIDAASAATDFAILAGLAPQASAAAVGAALLQGPVAWAYEVPASGEPKPFDRIVLRSRILPPANVGTSAAAALADQSKVTVVTSYPAGGLIAGVYATNKLAVEAAPVASGRVSLSTGQEDTTKWPGVTFYSGTGTRPANNVLQLNLSGVAVTVTFTATGTGTFTPVGPIATSGSVAYQINAAISTAMTAAGLGGSAYSVELEGSTVIHIMSLTDVSKARVTVGSGSANTALGFTAGTTYSTPVAAEDIASALMSHANTSLATWLTAPGTFANNTFAKYGLAGVKQDSAGAKYLYVQDAPTSTGGLGTASSVTVKDATAQSALAYGTGLGAVDGDGDTGDAAVGGFIVTSSNPDGSGSSNDSVLNDGVGADGVVGQTYRDVVTGLTFTVLPRGFSTNSTGPWTAYPTGASANFKINVGSTFVCNANVPVRAIPGVEMKVANTTGVASGDTALVKTFARSGNEPAIGDLYYASYVYSKQDFTTSFFTKMSAVEKAYGSAIPDNPVSLATYLAMINGAVLVGVKQVVKEPGENQASLTAYRNAIEELEDVLPGGATPDIVVPLRGDSLDLYQILKRSNDKMSSIRYKSERTSILGMAAGSLPKDAGNWAQSLSNTRMRLLYPDIATITIQDNIGNSKEFLVDGTFVAAAMAGSVASPNVDVATPWTGRRLVGFTQLGRRLDAVEMNQIASKGVTILEDKAPFLRVRHGLTTDMTNVLTKLPTVIQISDEVQRQSRNTLDVFIGIKFLPGVLSQVEGRLAMMLKSLVTSQIITAYTGVKANVASDDPTVAGVEAYYSPVFPLLYILVNFHLRSSL